MTIENRFDISFVASLALREKQIQQNYRPIIAVHKWFARRPGTLFRGLILAEFGDRPLTESFFRSNDFSGRTVADPFMGGGTPLLEANRVGCDVLGFDINPMATWIVREEIEHLDLKSYRRAADALIRNLAADTNGAYQTDCPIYGDADVPVKYFLWVKTINCERCDETIDLFPGYRIADDTRHPAHVLVCPDCGTLNEIHDPTAPGKCGNCRSELVLKGPARRNRCTCSNCGHENVYPRPETGPPTHRMFAIEYYNPNRKAKHRGRFFKKPGDKDIRRFEEVRLAWGRTASRYVPRQKIPPGDETDRLHRWGYGKYSDLFNERQLFGLELSAKAIASVEDDRIRQALATNLSDLLRYQNMLCRYDTTALKSLDVFSVHGFPVGHIQCESNLLGITNGRGVAIGSGGWTNVVNKYEKAKRFCQDPFEVDYSDGWKKLVPVPGEWIGEHLNGTQPRGISIRCVSSTEVDLKPRSLDAVFTDPPYFGNVQYGELMDFCYVWLKGLVGQEAEGFGRRSTRSPDELTGNNTLARRLDHFTEGIARTYRNMAAALKPGAPLAFTFHHNRIEVYHAIGVAILDAGLVCTATIPCPAEMSGSIHIRGTKSSIVDTVFVCRHVDEARDCMPFKTKVELFAIVKADLDQLRSAGMKPTAGDIRCIVFGHLTRMAIWRLHTGWDTDASTKTKLALMASTAAEMDDIEQLVNALEAIDVEFDMAKTPPPAEPVPDAVSL